MAALLLLSLNFADAWLTRADLSLGRVAAPLTPAFMADTVARLLVAAAAILILYLVKKRELLWWLNAAILVLITWHGLGYWLAISALPAPSVPPD